MTIPQAPTNCPPGLEYLSMIDQLLVKQKVELLEAFVGFETNNKYTVKNALGQKVYYAVEDNDCCTRNCCGPMRPFDMKIMDNFRNEVIHLHRPLACDSCWCPCWLQSMEVTAPPGTVVGSIEQEWSICKPCYVIKNAAGDVVLRIKGPICTYSICGDVEFNVSVDSCWCPCWLQSMEVTAPPGTVVGSIEQEWSICKPCYVIKNAAGDVVLRIKGPICTYSICGDVEFNVSVDSCWCPCWLQSMEVTAPPGTVVGSIEQEWSICKPCYVIKNAAGDVVLRIKGPICTYSICGDVEFNVSVDSCWCPCWLQSMEVTAPPGTVVGSIEQEWSICKPCYVIKNAAGDVVLRIKGPICTYSICGDVEFNVSVDSCWCPCWLQSMEVTAPPGTVVGSIEQEWSICKPCYVIKNAAGDVVLRIKGPICTYSICGDVEFNVSVDSCWCPCWLQSMEVTAPPGTVVGSIEQEWSICKPCYVIKNAAGDVVLRIKGPICTYSICGDVEFNVSVDSCWCPCWLQSMEVTAPPGTVVGSIEQEWSICKPCYVIKNAAGDVVLRIKGPICTYSICGDVEFNVYSRDGETKVGKITKQWSGLAREMFTDSDYFGITFPMDLDVRIKAVLLGACFLIDFMFFEKSGNQESDGPGML
ncbi:uncharacterized protein LOC123873000 isoform X3 [Maniola jurtina]|nr:uncharacterized protein LOC123873000 isoform X3 [Maniola jurtina]XP_045773637.1 uncharacterized protein LOC123873000 isoform X3 [Maniola jurtina]XP_045773645.1 uncharacterized protein LOC123873000 isoform X3 [Maniola jurtina]